MDVGAREGLGQFSVSGLGKWGVVVPGPKPGNPGEGGSLRGVL